jgi:predicted DNA-binding protein YlxM (UPF0122 family)
MDSMIWNMVLSLATGVIGFILKDKSAELSRVTILLNKTREEMAKEYVTRTDVHNDINRVLDRLERFENKLDAFMKEHRSA